MTCGRDTADAFSSQPHSLLTRLHPMQFHFRTSVEQTLAGHWKWWQKIVLRDDMKTDRPMIHPMARGIAAALILPLLCQPGCKPKPGDGAQPADRGGSGSVGSSDSAAGAGPHLKKSEYESQLA